MAHFYLDVCLSFFVSKNSNQKLDSPRHPSTMTGQVQPANSQPYLVPIFPSANNLPNHRHHPLPLASGRVRHWGGGSACLGLFDLLLFFAGRRKNEGRSRSFFGKFLAPTGDREWTWLALTKTGAILESVQGFARQSGGRPGRVMFACVPLWTQA